MSSIFSFMRPGEEMPGEEPATEPTADEEPLAEEATPIEPLPTAAEAEGAEGATRVANGASIPGQAIDKMLDDLSGVLMEWPDDLSQPSVSVASVTERPLAVGNRRGMERFGTLSAIELKGLRLDAVVHFQLLADDLDDVEDAAKEVQKRLLGASDALWARGFLRLAAREMSPAEHLPTPNAWRKTVEYEVLYEFHYQDTDGAESIIARIPIDIDSEYSESTEVTDEMVRWDKDSALGLEVRGGSRRIHRVSSVTILAYLAEDWNGSRVTLSASVGGAVRERTFADVREFRDAFDLERENVAEPGEEPEIKIVQLGRRPYVAGRMVFPNADFPDPLVLKGGEDIFNIRYDHERFRPDNQGETDSVVYLRVLN